MACLIVKLANKKQSLFCNCLYAYFVKWEKMALPFLMSSYEYNFVLSRTLLRDVHGVNHDFYLIQFKLRRGGRDKSIMALKV